VEISIEWNMFKYEKKWITITCCIIFLRAIFIYIFLMHAFLYLFEIMERYFFFSFFFCCFCFLVRLGFELRNSACKTVTVTLEPDLQPGKILFIFQLFVLIMGLWIYLYILILTFNYFMQLLLSRTMFSPGEMGSMFWSDLMRHGPQRGEQLVGVPGPLIFFLSYWFQHAMVGIPSFPPRHSICRLLG
jgi:hypothetical protein